MSYALEVQIRKLISKQKLSAEEKKLLSKLKQRLSVKRVVGDLRVPSKKQFDII